MNDTSHVDLRINIDEARLDMIELIGKFETQEVTGSAQLQEPRIIMDAVFDVQKSGLALPERKERIIDATGNVELLISESSVIMPLLTEPVAEWRYLCPEVALGCSRGGVLVALFFDNLNPEEHGAFDAIRK